MGRIHISLYCCHAVFVCHYGYIITVCFLLQYMNQVKQKAAFIYFSLSNFSQAETLFKESGCDPREV